MLFVIGLFLVIAAVSYEWNRSFSESPRIGTLLAIFGGIAGALMMIASTLIKLWQIMP